MLIFAKALVQAHTESDLVRNLEIAERGLSIAEKVRVLVSSRPTRARITARLKRTIAETKADGRFDASTVRSVLADVSAVFDSLVLDREFLIEAAIDSEKFRNAMMRKADDFRRMHAQKAEPLFDALIDTAVHEIVNIAKESDWFVPETSARIAREVQKSNALGSQTLQVAIETKNIVETLSTNNDTVPSPPYRVGVRMGRAKNFVSRALLEQLQEKILSEGAQGVWTLRGMRGSGKSQIASEILRQAEELKYPLTMWAVAASRSAVMGAYRELAHQILPHVDENDDETLARMVINAIQSSSQIHPSVLVFDNVENPDDLGGLVPEGNDIRIIVTTTGPSIEDSVCLEDNGYTPTESKAYLAQRLPNSSDDERGQLAEALQHLPLALSQATATMLRRHQSVPEYLQVLRDMPLAQAILREYGASYGETVVKALADAVSSTLDGFSESNRRCASEQLFALCYLAESGVPRKWLEVFGEDTVQGADTLAALVDYSILLESEDKEFVALHRLQAEVIRQNPSILFGESNVLRASSSVLSVLIPVIEQLKRHVAQLRSDDRKQHYSDGRILLSYLLDQLNQISSQPHSSVFLSHPRFGTLLRAILAMTEPFHCHVQVATVYPTLIALFEKSANTRESKQHLARVNQVSGRHSVAIALFDEVLTYCEGVFGAQHTITLASQNNLASAYQAAGDLTRAIPLYEDTLLLCRKHLSDSHPVTKAVQRNLEIAIEARDEG